MTKIDDKKDIIQLLQKHENFFVFVQKSNDLDSISSALALCRLIQLNIKHAKKIRIFGIHHKKSFIEIADKGWLEFTPEENLHKEIPPNTIAITVDVNNTAELLVVNRKILGVCDCILKIDHHTTPIEFLNKEKPEEVKLDEKFFEHIDHLQSCAEVIWKLAKEAKWTTTKKIAEIVYVGLCSENSFVMNRGTTSETLRIMAELLDEGADFEKIQEELWSVDKVQWLLTARVLQTSIWEKNMVCLNLTPEIAYDYYPKFFVQDPNRKGFISQRTLITFPVKLIYRLIKANTIIYIHYSLFKTFQCKDKYVFILNKSNNPEITKLLLDNNFRQHRQRFSRAFKEHELQDFLNTHCDILSK